MNIYQMIITPSKERWFYRMGYPDDVWFWDPLDQNGLCGDPKTFCIGDHESITVKGPWAGNAQVFFNDTGILLMPLDHGNDRD